MPTPEEIQAEMDRFPGITPEAAEGNLAMRDQPPPEVESSGITTSIPATSELDELGQMQDDLGLELAEQDTAAFDAKKDLLAQQLETNTANIEQQRKERLQSQEQAGKAILGESRAALAALGILSTEPGQVSATGAQQYLDDVKMGNQREIDNINAEMDLLLRAAKDSKDSGDLKNAQAQIDDANELRKERNNLRLNVAQEARLIRQNERIMDAQEFSQWLSKQQEKRAGENFDISKAQDALAILEKTGFEDFASYSPSEITQLEQSIGLPNGTLANYAANAAKLETLEGWSSTIQTNKNTGEVVAVYYRINPETKKIEIMEQSLGNIGDRFKADPAPGPVIDNTEGIDWTKPKEVSQAVSDMNSQLSVVVGDDGFVSPDNYSVARNAWIAANGSPTTFDTKFKGFRNPNNPNYVTTKQ